MISDMRPYAFSGGRPRPAPHIRNTSQQQKHRPQPLPHCFEFISSLWIPLSVFDYSWVRIDGYLICKHNISCYLWCVFKCFVFLLFTDYTFGFYFELISWFLLAWCWHCIELTGWDESFHLSGSVGGKQNVKTISSRIVRRHREGRWTLRDFITRPLSLIDPKCTLLLLRMTFGVDPDTHIDTVEQAKASTIEGTSKWSCKLSITGTNSIFLTHLMTSTINIIFKKNELSEQKF